MEGKRPRRGDVLLLAALLLIGFALLLVPRLTRTDGREAVVRVNGEVVARLPLGEDREYEITSDGEVTNLLRIEDGRARMVEANCPDKLCVRKGAVRYAGDGIVCLPNRVSIEIVGVDELGLDAVAG